MKIISQLFATITILALFGSSTEAQGSEAVFRGQLGNSNVIAKSTSLWSSMGAGVDNQITAVAVAPNGDVYAGGFFLNAGGSPASYVAKWDGSNWSALGTGVDNGVNAIAVAGNGDVYVGGYFVNAGGSPANHIAKWDGSGWSSLEIGVSDVVDAIAISGTDVYVGGDFAWAGGVSFGGSGSVQAYRIAKWNGSNWSALIGGSLNGIGGGAVRSIAISGNYAYFGGDFTNIGLSLTLANHVARWDITNSLWESMGSGIDGGGGSTVSAVGVNGSDVYVGGMFSSASGVPAKAIAKWNGSGWSALGTGVKFQNGAGSVQSVSVSGGEVYAGGVFYTAGGIYVSHIAKWDGSKWISVTTSLNNTVSAMAYGGGSMYVGGGFTAPFARAASFTDSPNSLPIEMSSVSARVNNANVELHWTTSTETNSFGFEVARRSISDRLWQKVGFVQGMGASNTLKEYSYIDKNVPSGRYVYRLKQVDQDGQFSYSHPVELEMETTPRGFALMQNYPNPFNPTTTIEYQLTGAGSPFNISLKVYDVLGREIASLAKGQQQAGFYQTSFDARPLSSGMYIYRLIATDNQNKRHVFQKKMLVVK